MHVNNELNSALHQIGFAAVLDAARAAVAHPYAAYIESALPEYITSTAAGSLLEVLHQGKTVQRHPELNQTLVEMLVKARFIEEEGNSFVPGKWRMTSYKGIFAVTDTPKPGQNSSVYIGEDSLHFVDWLSNARPCDKALDLGAGSGISCIALSKISNYVDAIEIDPISCEAIHITATLNSVPNKIHAINIDLTTYHTNNKYGIIIGNTPGVPIPPHIEYSPAGNGGFDGLSISKSALKFAEKSIEKKGQIFHKFESIGTDKSPFSEHLLKEMVERTGCSIRFVQHSRIPIEIRAAISTRWAAPLNKSYTPSQLLAEFDKHNTNINSSYFYTCSAVISFDGKAQFQSLPVYQYGDVTLDSKKTTSKYDHKKLTAKYISKLGTLPDGLWELEIEDYLIAPLVECDALITCMNTGATLREATNTVFNKSFKQDPINARCLYSLTIMLIDSLKA